MNNVVNKEVQPRKNRIDLSKGKARMRTILTASDNMATNLDSHDTKLIRKYRNRLAHDRHLLDEPSDRSLCSKLIRLFNIEIRARDATAPTERHLQKELG